MKFQDKFRGPTMFKQSTGRTLWVENRADVGAELYIYDEIGEWGVTATSVVEQLSLVQGSQLTVHINSPGGDVFEGIAIYNTLSNFRGTLDTVCDGLAASAASFIMQAGKTRTMSPHSQLMIHDAMGVCVGNADDLRVMLDLLDRNSDNIAAIYADRSGQGDVASWRETMKSEKWYSDTEAVAAGLADSVGPSPQVDARNETLVTNRVGVDKPAVNEASETGYTHHEGLSILGALKEAFK